MAKIGNDNLGPSVPYEGGYVMYKPAPKTAVAVRPAPQNSELLELTVLREGQPPRPGRAERLRCSPSMEGDLRAKFDSLGNHRITEANLNNPTTLARFSNFIKALDTVTYYKRFGSMTPEGVVNQTSGEDNSVHLFAYDGNKIIGCLDYAENDGYESGTVASPNIVVHGDYQGKGKGKLLMEACVKQLLEKGYRYAVVGVNVSNLEQKDKLLSTGWRETTDSAENPADDLHFFWRALNPKDAGKEPVPLD